MPVTRVNGKLDQLPRDFKLSNLNGIARGAYMHYNAEKAHGLPVGVQVVGQRLEEERVLAMMELIEEGLRANADVYELLELKSVQ